MDKNCIQLEMNFEGRAGNHFRTCLDAGIFQILAELPVPDASLSTDEVKAKYADFEYLVLSRKTPTALAFTDAIPDAMDPVIFASAVCQTNRDHHLLYLSGRDRAEKDLYEQARLAMGEGFKNFCCVSGKAVEGENAVQTWKRKFTESPCTLNLLKNEFGDSIVTGAVVNPFKYTSPDLCLQYSKLIRKVNAGASFAVTQYGWDILKMQELRWNLYQRSCHIPTLARLRFLTPEKAQAICEGKVPGVHISQDLEHVLKREMQYSRTQFEAAQIRRLQIHAAGARFLGYSGLQIAGAESPEHLEMLLDKIDETNQEFSDFATWSSMYHQYYERLDMAPYPYRFYFFEKLLQTAQPPDALAVNTDECAPSSSGERFRYQIGKLLCGHADELPAGEKRLTKKLLFGCRSCEKCRLPQTFYICPETCPMHRANGPCGETGVDGSCPFYQKQKRECIYLRQMRLVNDLHEFPALEENVIPGGWNKG